MRDFVRRMGWQGGVVTLALIAVWIGIWGVYAVSSLHRAWPYPLVLPDRIAFHGHLWDKEPRCLSADSVRETMLVSTLNESKLLGTIPSALEFGAPEFYGTWPKRPTGYVYVQDGNCYVLYADEAV
jgi:hypothetical protein